MYPLVGKMDGAWFVVRAHLFDLCQSDCARAHSSDTGWKTEHGKNENLHSAYSIGDGIREEP